MRSLLSMGALACVLGVAAPVAAQAPNTDGSAGGGRDLRDLVVTAGEAVVKHAADQAFVVLTAENRAKSPAEAQKLTATAMTGVQTRLKGAGIAAAAIRTLQYELQPEFDYNSGKQTLRGYVARNSIEVKIDPIERAGEVIDLAVQSGATSVSSLRFDVKDREALEREALAKAVESARARAEAAAKGAGRSIDRIVKIEDQGVAEAPPPRPYAMAMRAAADAAPQTPVQAGEIELKGRVTLTAALK
jgi:uncharacterized protein YggE